jgi:hypothetical protein
MPLCGHHGQSASHVCTARGRCRAPLLVAQRVRPGPAGAFSDPARLAGDASELMSFDELLAEAGYRSQANHRVCRKELGVHSLIPAKTRRLSRGGSEHLLSAGCARTRGSQPYPARSSSSCSRSRLLPRMRPRRLRSRLTILASLSISSSERDFTTSISCSMPELTAIPATSASAVQMLP